MKNIIIIMTLSLACLQPVIYGGVGSKDADLIDAAKGDKKEKVVECLRRGSFVNARDGAGNTALIYAAKNGNVKIAEILISKRTDVNFVGEKEWTPLGCAIESGNYEMVKLLLSKKANPNKRFLNDWAPLSWAAMSKSPNIQIVKLLVENGAQVKAKGSDGGNAFYRAACMGNYDVAKYLAEQGSDINVGVRAGCSPSGGNETALMAAARVGNDKIAKLLIDKGADLNIKRSDNKTALQIAQEGNNTGVANMLIKAGAKK